MHILYVPVHNCSVYISFSYKRIGDSKINGVRWWQVKDLCGHKVTLSFKWQIFWLFFFQTWTSVGHRFHRWIMLISKHTSKCTNGVFSSQKWLFDYWRLHILLQNQSIYSNEYQTSLSDILFSFVLEKYIVCDVCGLRSPSFESSSVLYISPTDTSSMQNLILQGLQQKFQKSCSRCNKNTWHVESSYILQPLKYVLLFVNRFRYINNNVTKDRYSIYMETTVRLGPLKFSLFLLKHI